MKHVRTKMATRMMTMIIIARDGPCRSSFASSVSVATHPKPTNENTASEAAPMTPDTEKVLGLNRAVNEKPLVSGCPMI